MAELQLLVDDVVLKSFPLNKKSIYIGRSPENDIVIDEEAASTVHARLDMSPSKLLEGYTEYVLEDLGSTNGTFVNNKKINRQEVHNLDYIRIAFTDFKLIADKSAKLAKTTVIL
ncbi:MAG: FHA domain-containing protein, partial [Gammaproteobacteria bacterium]|nr:FHA domain-containing protein [Gammaproteobacteria bacterium]